MRLDLLDERRAVAGIFPPQARHLYFEASVMIIGLINLGHALEQRARQRASQALERLLDLTRRRPA